MLILLLVRRFQSVLSIVYVPDVGIVVQQNSEYQMMSDLRKRPIIGFRVPTDFIIMLCRYYNASICFYYYWCNVFKVF